LLLTCERTIRDYGFSDLYLHVLETNQPAQRLYSKLGYQVQHADALWLSCLFQRPRRLLLHKRFR
ncbi:MAG TPA: GNAT family N-acetyltransferase, partial [Candidatus Caenarcaniphilales bacterium]